MSDENHIFERKKIEKNTLFDEMKKCEIDLKIYIIWKKSDENHVFEQKEVENIVSCGEQNSSEIGLIKQKISKKSDENHVLKQQNDTKRIVSCDEMKNNDNDLVPFTI